MPIIDEAAPASVRRLPAFAWVFAGVAVFAASVLMYRQIIATYPGQWTHTDEYVYRAAGALIRRHPPDLYHALLGAPWQQQLPFTYPPFVALVFAAASPLPFWVWQVALVVIDLILLPVISYLALGISGRRGPGGAAVAMVLAAMAVWLEPVYMTMFFGQVNLILLGLIIADLALPDSSRWKGVGIGLAAGVKLTPLIFIVYLLASRRMRAGLVSLLTFAVTIAIGFVALPTASRDFWGGRFAVPGDNPGRLQNQSLYGSMLRSLPGSPATHTVWLAAAIVVGVAGMATAVVASRRSLELLGVVLCGVTGVLVSPISWSHHWVWAVVSLALMAAGAERGGAAAVRPQDWIARALGAAAILTVFVMWPAR